MTTSTLPTATTLQTTNKKFLVVSDVHNQFTTLELLIEFTTKKHYTACDILEEGFHIVFLGDLIHKGPGEDCPKVVSLVQSLVEAGKATCIRGNHDFTVRKGKFGNEEHEGSLTDEQAAWLKSRPLFVRYDGWLFMHGGMTGSCQDTIQKLIDEGQLPEKGDWTAEMVEAAESSLSSKFRKKLQNCMYTRYVKGEKRQLVSWGNETEETPFWAEDYDGRFGYVLFGHNPWTDIAYFPCALGIDLGAGGLERDLDTPRHGLGYELRARRMCGIKIDRGEIKRAVAYEVDNPTFFGLPQFSDGIGILRDWSIANFSRLKDLSFEAVDLYRDYCDILEECDPNWEIENRVELAINGALLNSKHGFDLVLPEKEPRLLGALTKLVEMTSLNIAHSSGSDESPSARLKHELIDSSVDGIRIGLAYDLGDACREVIENHWMPLVPLIRESEGYTQDFRDMLTRDYVRLIETGGDFPPLLRFYDAVCTKLVLSYV